ncbi:MAG TPA: EAL domain-containing protein [Bacilli bacterium]
MRKQTKWLERARMLLSLPLSGQAIKYFPPEFVLRDPIASRIYRQLKHDYGCALILLNLENFHPLQYAMSAAEVGMIERTIRHEIRRVLPLFFVEKCILGARQMHGEDYCLFISARKNQLPRLHDTARLIRDELERRINALVDTSRYGRMHFRFGFYMIEKSDLPLATAMSLAYHYAHAVATKKLPENFYCTRKQLADIIATGNIHVLFQPILNLQSGIIYGWEVLTRGPENTVFYQPTELFELAYQSDLLTELERLVFKKAIDQISRQLIGEQVFINITAVSLAEPRFFDSVLEILYEYPEINTRNLVLEITEAHSIRDFDHTAAMIRNYRAQGFRFAIDDAGSGYSSLQTISQLIPDLIKIDKSLIQNIDRVAVKQSLLRALVGLAAEINCQIIAEGIERKEEAELLSQHRIEMGQGFYFAKPQIAI